VKGERHVLCLVAVTIALAGCVGEPSALMWKVTTSDDGILATARGFEAEIRRDGCDGVVVHRDVFRDAPDTPPVLGAGRYAFSVVARDTDCGVIGRGCEVVDLPTEEECVEVVLTAASGDGCALGFTCEAGVCTAASSDASADTASADSGARDTGAPDTSPGSTDACVPVAEVCNGIDDDCNSLIDDGASVCSSVAECVPGHIDDSAYLVCTNTLSWPDARDFCTSYGYHLVVIDDLEESTTLELAMAVAGNKTGHSWIGLYDFDADGSFEDDEWVSGSSSYRRWRAGEPAMTGRCVAIHLPTDWEARLCDGPHEFVCEAP
jgi:hypothetical protein